MIVVIADDFTGAAEIAGLGLRYGLKVEIESHSFTNSDADLLIIATDTRSMQSEEAYKEVHEITKQLKDIDCQLIYKKTDSVFRGHIYKELSAMLDAAEISQALLVPANPSLGRKIENGIYYVDKYFLHETNFSEDPEYALTNSDVMKLINANGEKNVTLLLPNTEIRNDGITIGEAVSEKDLKKWAEKIKPGLLPAGGAGFFAAILEDLGYKENIGSKSTEYPFGKNFLFVCGSAFTKGQSLSKNFRNCKITKLPMPDDVFYKTSEADEAFNEWEKSLVAAFCENNAAMIEIDKPVVREKNFSHYLREQMAKLTHEVFNHVKINELFIDGGATVYSITEKLKLQKLFPVQELAPGVIRMKVNNIEDLYLTIKPGSYPWPDVLLDLPCKQKKNIS